ncbi:MAG TPA: hypothetical protein VMV12_00650 [Candidatus Micrarchaeaceae archaeon]|nr:hypothetical protein [Candidatus Micrarchaeaceae archaeon]
MPELAWLRIALSGLVLLSGMLGVMTTPSLAEVAELGAPLRGPAPYSPTGADLSYPQCGLPLPFDQAFAVVGLNYGRDNTLNPCFGEELSWAALQTTGDSPEPDVSVYLNTGDPGNSYLGELVSDWPSAGITPFGSCLAARLSLHFPASGQVSLSCAYQYGFLKATQDLAWLRVAAARDNLPTAPAAYPIWLDVETSNSWESATELNVADLQGMVAALQGSGVTAIGVYALPAQWQAITGGANSLAFGSFPGLKDWILGADSLQAAQAECSQPPFVGSAVALAQFPTGTFDGDYGC